MFIRICKITFITHGATVYSTNGIINDKIKTPKLNDMGEEEIKGVCDYLKRRGVAYDNIYTSPNVCCVESAQIIAKMFKKTPTIIDLNSRMHGSWHGMSYADLYDEFGIEFITQTPDGGEDINTFNKRVDKLIKKLVSDNHGSRIIVVTTPEVIQSAIAKAIGISSKNQNKILVKTGSLTQISYFKGWSSLIYSDYKPL